MDPGGIEKTSSGKLARQATRERWGTDLVGPMAKRDAVADE
jgi:hypothetical protein